MEGQDQAELEHSKVCPRHGLTEQAGAWDKGPRQVGLWGQLLGASSPLLPVKLENSNASKACLAPKIQ